MTIFKNTPQEKTFDVLMDYDTILELTDGTHVEIHAQNKEYQAAWIEDGRALAYSPVITDKDMPRLVNWLETLPSILPEGVTFTESEPQAVKL